MEGKLAAFLDVPKFREAGICLIAEDFSRRLERQDGDDLLAQALEELLGFIGQHKVDGEGRRYVDTAIALAHKCKANRPGVVRGLFNAVDTILKRQGDKKKVLDAADLAIETSRHPHRTEEDVQIEARAIICGRSWVLQRVGHLEEALAEAEKSLHLGENIRWERNTAFCKKCLGRIYRLMAMRESDPIKKRDYLAQSIESLKGAVNIFKKMEKFGPDHPEVGDCHSLAARTFLVAGQNSEARSHLKRAAARLVDENDKDYLDYQILEGDYAIVTGNPSDAERYYDKVIAAHDFYDCEKSEIRARALHQRGVARKEQRNKNGAIADFEQAALIWGTLGERQREAEASWEKILLEGNLSPKSIAQLEKVHVTARVIAVTTHGRKMSTLSGTNSRRSEPDRRYWDQVIRDAREQDAKQDIAW